MNTLSLLLVGGTFNNEGGRPSGYFGKLAEAVCAALPEASSRVINGGSFDFLREAVGATEGVSHLFWFADVPNDLPKLLPVLKERYPGLILVSSKNNRRRLYQREALFERMRKSRSELLVEFGEGSEGVLVASVLSIQGEVLLDSVYYIDNVATCLAARFRQLATLRFPLSKSSHVTRDADSFSQRDLERETEIPVGAHPGAFGVERLSHIHEGVDLYGLPGDAVYAMERGIVVARRPFTGPAAGSPWWQDTECILIAGVAGVLNYGELAVQPDLKVDDVVLPGQKLGELVTVLRKDKGRPQTMLHLERYSFGTRAPVQEWSLDGAQPENLCDPTALLIQAGARKRICIVGERGLVSGELQERLAGDSRYAVTVVSTDTVLQSPAVPPDILAADLVVLCTLEFSSPQVVGKMPPEARVLDISPAFRTDPAWAYGLPELPGMRERIVAAKRVANPGCFATSAILALEPLVRTGALRPDAPVYLDAAGGFTTGGTAMVEKEAAGELAAEAVFSLTREHRHIPEIKYCSGLTGPVAFNPKIARVARGIRMQIPLFGLARETAVKAYQETYAGTSVLVDEGSPSRIPVDEWAFREGACLRVFDQPGGCLVICTMDNLGKGAVESALDNIVLMLTKEES